MNGANIRSDQALKRNPLGLRRRGPEDYAMRKSFRLTVDIKIDAAKCLLALGVLLTMFI